jgi:predicted  nucleic acid-binding Zn-ribbon protein
MKAINYKAERPMYEETIKNFIEIYGLTLKIDTLKKEIELENRRISAIEQNSKARADELNAAENDLKALNIKGLEINLSSLQEKHSKLKEQYSQIKNDRELQSYNHEIEALLKNIEELESSLFVAMEKEEILNQKILQAKNFLAGISTTKNEIEMEVKSATKGLDDQVENYNNRINALVLELPNIAKTIYLETKKRSKNSIFMSFVENKICSHCHTQVDAITSNNVINAICIEVCPNCGKILLPTNFRG